MPFKMTTFVFWSGVYNAGLALTLTCPPFYRWLGLNVPAPLWGWLVAGFLAFTSVTLFGLPKELGVSHQTLLYDHSTTNA